MTKQNEIAIPLMGLEEAERPRLAAVLGRLEEIRRQLDRDDLDLEEQVQLYREGCSLVVSAKGILETSRAEVEFLMAETDGAPAEG